VNGFPASFSSTFRCISFISFERHKLNWKMVQTSICSFEAQLITLIAYAFYFDYKRRNDPQFRKQLKKESKRQARAAKEEAEAQTVQQRQSIRRAVEEAKEEGFPTDVEEKEAYFMSEVARGEGLSGDGKQYAPYSQT
jgi:import receptor subunit TOM20